MSASEETTISVDPDSQRRLRENGLEYRIADMSVDADAEGFLRADSRGFLDEDPTDAELAQMRETMRARRNIGVYDPSAGTWPIAGFISPTLGPSSPFMVRALDVLNAHLALGAQSRT